MRENIRSGRRANFFITENSFIDNYAKAVGPMCAVIYNVLERYMNSETRSTWVGTAKIAEVVGAHQRTVQRNLKTLEEFKLIRILKTASATTYVVLPVPARPKESTIPLFETVDDQDVLWKGDTAVADATQASFTTTEPSYYATATSRSSDTGDTPNKEEQESFNQTLEQENTAINKSAHRIIRILKLPDTFITAATAAVSLKTNRTTLSMDDVVREIVTEANHAERRGISKENFLEDFLARSSAQQILEDINLPVTNSLVVTVTAAVKAEAKDTGLPLEEVAALITNAAIEDRRRGIAIDRFYFEGVKWRNANGSEKGKSRAHRNLDAALDARAVARRALGLDH